MGYVVRSMYKQALAHYNITTQEGCRIATLLNYDGQQHNRPPARFIVMQEANSLVPLRSTLGNDICHNLAGKEGHQPDPLFPEKSFRPCIVDQLV